MDQLGKTAIFHVLAGEGERRSIDLRLHERQRIHLAPKEIGNKDLHGFLEGSSSKNCLSQVLNVFVENFQGGDESDGGEVGPIEDSASDGVMDTSTSELIWGTTACDESKSGKFEVS